MRSSLAEEPNHRSESNLMIDSIKFGDVVLVNYKFIDLRDL